MPRKPQNNPTQTKGRIVVPLVTHEKPKTQTEKSINKDDKIVSPFLRCSLSWTYFESDSVSLKNKSELQVEGVLLLSIIDGFYLKGDDIHFQPQLHGSPSIFSKKLWTWKHIKKN